MANMISRFQWSTQTQELSKDIRINTSKGHVETESVRAMKEQRGLLGVVGPLRNWSSQEGAEWGEMLCEGNGNQNRKKIQKYVLKNKNANNFFFFEDIF